MNFPIFKILSEGVRILSKPINSLMIASLRARSMDSYLKCSFVWFGQFCHKMEYRVNKILAGADKPFIVQTKEN